VGGIGSSKALRRQHSSHVDYHVNKDATVVQNVVHASSNDDIAAHVTNNTTIITQVEHHYSTKDTTVENILVAEIHLAIMLSFISKLICCECIARENCNPNYN